MTFYANLIQKSLLALSLSLPLVTGSHVMAGDFKLIHQQDGELDIQENGKLIGRYMYAHDTSTPEVRHATYKPYLHVIDPETGNPITKGSGGQFTHHRGVYLGWNRLTTERGQFDFWHMNGCFQVHQHFSNQFIDKDKAGFTSQINWVDTKGKTVIQEWRTMAFPHSDLPNHLATIDFSTKLVPTEDVELKGDPEHAGFQYRPANEVNKKATRYYFPKEGQDPRKDLDLPWVGEQYQVAENTYSVIHMNHPDNPKKTRYSAYRDYGRFGAFFTKALKQNEALEIQYRLIILKTTMPEKAAIQKLYKHWSTQ